jgi:cytochrome c biogenesis factor
MKNSTIGLQAALSELHLPLCIRCIELWRSREWSLLLFSTLCVSPLEGALAQVVIDCCRAHSKFRWEKCFTVANIAVALRVAGELRLYFSTYETDETL